MDYTCDGKHTNGHVALMKQHIMEAGSQTIITPSEVFEEVKSQLGVT
jgi:hypothetical protein